jgi:ATP synthase protein I
MEEPPSRKKRLIGIAEAKMLATASSIGFAMLLSIFIGAFLGHYLDGKLGTNPWLLLTGLLVGVAAAFNNLIILSRRLERKRKEIYGDDGKGKPGPGNGPEKDPKKGS